ncbi:MAG: class I SAM-dependent methyltransferase [bacterium]|nr:class I SAM-dependent methyltransferase [bacterium]
MPYYADNLSGENLRRCYEVAPSRVRRYLDAEIAHVRDRLRPADTLLELGCGYGRIVFQLAPHAARCVGIDTAPTNLELAARLGASHANCEFLLMDAANLALADDAFDAVVCLQNGIRAFGCDQEKLVREAVRVCRPGGQVLFSSYAEEFWPHRLAWFETQAAHGLMGAIDHKATGDGVIVCEDGFRAGFMRPADFTDLWRRLGIPADITQVDGSATFCACRIPGDPKLDKTTRI